MSRASVNSYNRPYSRSRSRGKGWHEKSIYFSSLGRKVAPKHRKAALKGQQSRPISAPNNSQYSRQLISRGKKQKSGEKDLKVLRKEKYSSLRFNDSKKVKIETSKPIGYRISDVGPSGKESNIKESKHWKTKKFSHTKYYDDEKYGLAGTSKTKNMADARAKRYREKGWNARVEKQDTGTEYKYAVYVKKNKHE